MSLNITARTIEIICNEDGSGGDYITIEPPTPDDLLLIDPYATNPAPLTSAFTIHFNGEDQSGAAEDTTDTWGIVTMTIQEAAVVGKWLVHAAEQAERLQAHQAELALAARIKAIADGVGGPDEPETAEGGAS